jgi:hypothetical protein
MGQKVNPISLRLQQTNREFDNSWYTDYFYRKLVSRDIYLQHYINNFLKLVKCPSARFSIQYTLKNIKLYSFLCYPKQSRELRSRMFGITFQKKRKNNLKKKYQLSSFLLGKKQTRSFSSPRHTLRLNQLSHLSIRRPKMKRFLVDNRLWSRVSNPFSQTPTQPESSTLLQNNKHTAFLDINKQQNLYTNKDTTPLNTLSVNSIYNAVISPMYTNNKLTICKNYRNKPLSFLLPSLSRESFHKTIPQLVSLEFQLPYTKQMIQEFTFDKTYKRNSENEKKNYQPQPDLFKSKELILNGNSFYNVTDQKLDFLEYLHPHKKQNNYLLYFIKNFIATLVFVKILNTRNSGVFNKKQQAKKFSQHSNNFTKFNRQYRKNFLKFFLVFCLLYTEYNRNTLSSKDCIVSNSNLLELNKQKFAQNLLNQINCFSNFQSISIFHATVQNKTPINLLLQYNSSAFPQNTKQTCFYNVKRDEKLNTIDFLQGKKNANLLQLSQFLNTGTNLIPNGASKMNRTNSIYDVNRNKHQLKYKNYVQGFLFSQFNINTEFVPFSVSQDWQSAGFLAEEIVYFLERRVTFRRLKNKILKKISEISNIRGVRISCSGRVGGKSKKAQRAKTECVKYGQTSRHTFSSRIDFAAKTARTSFGTVGIKVWICYN